MAQIYTIQEKNSFGTWDLTGDAFVNETNAEAFIAKLRAKHLFRSSKTLSDWFPGATRGMGEVEFVRVTTSSPNYTWNVLEQYDQACGDLYSWEIVNVRDLEQ